MPRTRLPLQACLFSALVLAGPARAQDPLAPTQAGTGQGGAQAGTGAPRVDRERMWYAPTAEDWKKPCLITWQRTYEDALQVSQETKKPILVCVNMDGEIASEHYAGVRYREPEIAKLYEPYVCVIASVYRHNPRDHDEEGRRIPCPRFGSVTCGEHIAIEPGLFDQFFDGQRVAPRHIGVELDKREVYDVYYAWDTDTIFDSLRQGIANRDVTPETIVRDDRPVLDRVGSAAIEDRIAVETAYAAGDRTERRALIERAVGLGAAVPVELLRLAIFGLDVDLARAARAALAQSRSPAAVDLILESLRVPMEASERDALIGALEAIGETVPRARTFAKVQRGLARGSDTVAAERWPELPAGPAPAPVPERAELEARLEERAREAASRAQDAAARLALAESFLELAADPRSPRKFADLMAKDARRTAREAVELGARGWRADAAQALAAWYDGDPAEALARAEAAVRGLPEGTSDWTSMAALALFATARQQAVTRAQRERADWPSSWLSDVHAAYTALARHPLGTAEQVAAHVDFLSSLGAAGQAVRALDRGLERYPEAAVLHERLRNRILAERGVAGLEPAYAERLRAPDAPPSLADYAGYASLVTAEHHRRAGDGGEALAAYARGQAHYEAAAARAVEDPAARLNADHFVAMAHAGKARIEYERGDDERALAELLASFARRPASAATPDGLNVTAVDTAKMLRARLVEKKRDDLLLELQKALDALDPELLELPAYERQGPQRTPRDGRPPRRGDGRRGG